MQKHKNILSHSLGCTGLHQLDYIYMLLATGCHHKPTQKPQSCHFSNFFFWNYDFESLCKKLFHTGILQNGLPSLSSEFGTL